MKHNIQPTKLEFICKYIHAYILHNSCTINSNSHSKFLSLQQENAIMELHVINSTLNLTPMPFL